MPQSSSPRSCPAVCSLFALSSGQLSNIQHGITAKLITYTHNVSTIAFTFANVDRVFHLKNTEAYKTNNLLLIQLFFLYLEYAGQVKTESYFSF